MKLIRNLRTVISDPRFALEYVDYCGSKLRHGHARRRLPGDITISNFSGFSEFHSVKDFVNTAERSFFTRFPFGQGVMFDVGANLGVISILLSKNSRGRPIFAFEPNPSTFAALSKNLRLNAVAEVKAHQAAVADEDGSIAFAAESLRRGTASIVKRGENSIVVPSVTLDSFVAQHSIQSIAAIKVDVEGFETAVFRGSRRILEEQLPSVIYYEVCPRITRQAGFDPLDATLLLQAHGYEIFALRENNKLERITPATAIRSADCENWIGLLPKQIVSAGSWIR